MKRTILFAAILATLVGCSDRQAQYPQQYQQPAVVYQQPAPQYQQPVVVQQHDNSAAALATGVAIGAMMNNNNNNNRDREYRQPTRVVERTVIVNQAPVPVQTPSTYNRAMPAPAPVTRPGQSLYIPAAPVKPAPYVATSYAPRNVVTPVMAPARPVVSAPAPRPTVSYAPTRPTTTYSAPARTTSYSAPKTSYSAPKTSYSAPARTSSFSTTKSTSSSSSSFKR